MDYGFILQIGGRYGFYHGTSVFQLNASEELVTRTDARRTKIDLAPYEYEIEGPNEFVCHAGRNNRLFGSRKVLPSNETRAIRAVE